MTLANVPDLSPAGTRRSAARRSLALLMASVGLGFCATMVFLGPALAETAPALSAPARQVVPTLRREVVVARDVITLADLIDHAGPNGETAAFRAPALGRSGTIQAARIVEAARSAGIATIDTALVSQVVVTRAARKVQKAEMEEAVRKALSGRYGLDQADVVLSLEGNETAIFVEPEAVGDLKVQDLTLDPRGQTVEATIGIAGSHVLLLKPLRVAGKVVDTVEVPILMRPLAKGDLLRASDVRLERRPRSEAASGGFADMNQLTGRIARAGLQAGTFLHEADLAKQELVEKGSAVSVVYESPGLQLSMRGKAMEAGGMGDVVLIQNLQSKRTLQGTVVGPGKVAVIYGTPGPVASAGPAPASP